jgi:hypothetical protein
MSATVNTKIRMMALLLLSLSVLFLSNCAEKLPREVSVNRPIAKGEPLDIDKIFLTDLSSGEAVNLGEYMRSKNLTHMVLTFGSRSCGACLEKASYLEANLVGNSQALGPNADTFELRGVNVDPDASRGLVQEMVSQFQLTHIAWSDPTKATMMTYFQPPKTEFGVPLTVMISRTSLLWRVGSKESLTAEDLLRKIAATLGENVTPVLPPVIVPPPPINYSILADERPDRLSALPVLACENNGLVNADDVFGISDLKFIVLDRGTCGLGTTCRNNLKIIEEFMPICSGKNCKVMALATDHPDISETCDRKVRKGGKELLDVFADHFNWRYKGVGSPRSLPQVAGPIVLAFDGKGRLVFSHEGPLEASQLEKRWTTDSFTDRARGPDFRMFDGKAETSFGVWRQKSDYSFAVFWDPDCESCQDEINLWHQPGNLLDYCKNDPDFCQVMSVETGAYYAGGSFEDYVSFLVMEYMDVRAWTIPLFVEPLPPDNEYRWFQNSIQSKFMSPVNRSVVYDREGKVRATWEKGTVGPDALETIKTLKSESSSRGERP